ncbi:MAG TPA: rRNA cytosine-C5-methyltransferase, partial [Paludibacteraceae bacterium]|nr:rRNA cytosine-C5-methyltransferase [Paludibacteraceae bacterium]
MKKLPEDFVKQAKELFGNSYEAYTNAINSEVVNSIRINDKLTLNLDFEKVKWCDTGYYLSERPNFTLDPFLHAGAYYVQEASSMFLEQFLKKYVSA